MATERPDGAWIGGIDIGIEKAKTARFFDMPTRLFHVWKEREPAGIGPAGVRRGRAVRPGTAAAGKVMAGFAVDVALMFDTAPVAVPRPRSSAHLG
jgi:uncharacterized protein GlcG (DUF336 family)